MALFRNKCGNFFIITERCCLTKKYMCILIFAIAISNEPVLVLVVFESYAQYFMYILVTSRFACVFHLICCPFVETKHAFKA